MKWRVSKSCYGVDPMSDKIQLKVTSEQSDVSHVYEKVRQVLHGPGHILCDALIKSHYIGVLMADFPLALSS